jgi:dolichol kinase
MDNWQKRKILHIFTGPIYLISWPLFSNGTKGSLFAMLVPLVMTLKFVLVGLGIIKDVDMVNTSARTGRREELLKGPFLYGIIFILSTIFFWKTTSGIIYLFTLCFGDGMAEIIGRAYGRGNSLPWSPRKSFAGLFAFIISSYFATMIFLYAYGPVLFRDSPHELEELSSLPSRLIWVSVVAGLVETLPVEDVDNVSVFLSVAVFEGIRKALLA